MEEKINLADLKFKGFFINRDGNKRYELFSVLNDNLENTFKNIINNVESEYAILLRSGIDLDLFTYNDVKNFEKDYISYKLEKGMNLYYKANSLEKRRLSLLEKLYLLRNDDQAEVKYLVRTKK